MTRWVRVTQPCACGRCGTALAADAPALMIQIIGMTRIFLRCPACADRPVPPDLAPPAAPVDDASTPPA